MASTSASPSLASAAVQNPMFRQAVFEAVAGDDVESQQRQNNALLGLSDAEKAAMSSWAKKIRLAMIIIGTLMFIVAFYNFASTSASLSSNFLAIYVLFFATLICCYEVALKQVSFYIAQNFGFMYAPMGRSIFLALAAFMCFELSTFGKVMFALLVVMGIVQIYVNVKHPRFEEYMRSLHFKQVSSSWF
jgi:Ca2+/Na+ antiporter